MKKNDELTLVCERLGSNGEGVARAEGYTVFVPQFLDGERALVKILSVKDKVAYGKIAELYTPAEQRVRPRCGAFGKCGGCQLQHIRYRDQLLFKTDLVRNALKKIGGIDAEVLPCVKSDREYDYRNKLILPIGRAENGVAVGFYAERSHRIVGIEDCPITGWSGKVISAVKNFAEKCGLDGYDEATHTGQLRHIVVREIGKRYLVVLVVTKEIKGIDYFLSLLDKIFKEYSLFLNFNDQDTNAVFGGKFQLVKGNPTFPGKECGITFEAGAETFVQINGNVRAKLYESALTLVDEGDTVIDCYSGGGLLTAMFAKKCKRAYGIELVREAVECADRLKVRNGLEKKMFNLAGRVEEKLPDLVKKEPNAVAVLDPPRAGLNESVVSLLLGSGVKKVVMISCNPATLARDLGLLTGTLAREGKELKRADAREGKFEIISVQPFDMFPQTRHVETLVVLSHKKPDSHIEVKIDMDDTTLDTAAISERAEQRKPKDKPTYKKMQAWIEENYGFKVHTGYIAEVKRNEGLPMYDAPNAVEELKHPRPHPTPQMVEAIKAALKHFEII